MSYLHCPYCEAKKNAKVKVVYKALQPIDGECPDCGAWIDAGQQTVKVNGYADIYKGAIALIDDMVATFNRILYDLDIDLKDASIFIQDIAISENGYVVDVGNWENVNAEVALRLAERIKRHPILWNLFFRIA